MKINKAKTKGYDLVEPEFIYDYIREYANKIISEVEPEEDSKGNSYKEKKEQFSKCNKTELKMIAAELETVVKRLDYMLHGRY